MPRNTYDQEQGPHGITRYVVGALIIVAAVGAFLYADQNFGEQIEQATEVIGETLSPG